LGVSYSYSEHLKKQPLYLKLYSQYFDKESAMKKLLGIFLIISITTYVFAEETYWANGNVRSIGSFKDGDKEGEWKYYNENGELAAIGLYEDGDKEGEWKYYHKNGELAEIGLYDVDFKEGKWKIYNKDGQFDRIEHWEDGELIRTSHKILHNKKIKVRKINRN
tara:strand:- start:465 stop:956 length:492 start_codon:yes stop_codon:yes gene_type:complete